MRKPIAPTHAGTRQATDPLMGQFARQLRDHYHARVYLFASRVRGTDQAQSDYDLVAVAASFGDTSRFRRCLNRDSLWLDAGGWRKPLDLHCYTPEEFRRQKAGLGYLGDAHRRGELLRILPATRQAIADLDHRPARPGPGPGDRLVPAHDVPAGGLGAP